MSELKPFLERSINGGIQKLYRFDNNYGASVIRHNYSYGSEEGLWELAVLEFESEDNNSWELCYETPVTSDVLGHLTDEEVEKYLDEINKLVRVND